MKIHILYQFQTGPYGGGNQFLKALRQEFINQDVYEESPEKAEIILFNSHHQLKNVLKLKSKYPEKIFIHRLGPIFYYHRGKSWKKYDKQIINLTNRISEGVVFQSAWSKEQAKELGFNEAVPNKIIYNAPIGSIFNKQNKKPFKASEKIKLIAMSWSDNMMKGFDVFKYLDEHLEFSKYEMTFVGNSPFEFENIKIIKPIAPKKVASILKENDIFITPAKMEACSNALIEALSSGLPVVAVDSASNSEIVRKGGELFQGQEDIIEKIKKVAENYNYYQQKIQEFSIKESSQQYYTFIKNIYSDIKQGRGEQKQVDFFAKISLIKLKLFLLKQKL